MECGEVIQFNGGRAVATDDADRRAEEIARNVAAAPPFKPETLEKLAMLFAPAVAKAASAERNRRAARGITSKS